MLFSHCFFDWKIGAFQQRVVRVYCILKEHLFFEFSVVTAWYMPGLVAPDMPRHRI